MSTHQQAGIDPQAVRSRARGRGFLIPLVGAWPVGVLIGLVAVVLGAGMAVALASGLSVALGLNFVWVAVTFAIDDGKVEERARDAVAHEGPEAGDHATEEPPRAG